MRNTSRKTVKWTEEGTMVTTQGNEITLETPKATVTKISSKFTSQRDLAWLARDVFSTDSAYRS